MDYGTFLGEVENRAISRCPGKRGKHEGGRKIKKQERKSKERKKVGEREHQALRKGRKG